MSEEEKKAIEQLRKVIKSEKITKLEKEIEELKEDNKSYKYILDMQNKREYRSKFLKDFQKENGKNMLPDYDEIYKRYDKQKEEIERLKNAEEYSKLGKEELLDTIHKQKEEIETLKEVDKKICNEELLEKDYVLKNYISKDKIRDKIKELEKEKDLYFEKQIIQGKIDLLKELLED